MKEKKTTEVATNLSSGAQKVETIEKEQVIQTLPNDEKQANDGGRVEMNVKKEEVAAKKRVEKAKEKQAVKNTANQARIDKNKQRKERLIARKKALEKRLAERKARAEKRAAERKARAEKRLAERKARAEKRAAEREARIRERAHEKANRRQKTNSQNKRNKENKNSTREKRQSYGGWLAAVIALGAVTLGLTTALTVGAIEMNKMNENMLSGYKSTAYELIGIMEHVDDDLDRIRVSASPVQQERILTDLLVQSRLAALDLEKAPIDGQSDQNLTAFINRVGKTSERLLTKLRLGGSLSQEDVALLEKLYQTNHSVKQQIEEISTDMDDSMLMEYVKKGMGKIQEVLNGLEELTLDENGKLPKPEIPKMEGAGKERNAIPDGMDGENAQGSNPAKAEEACLKYFENYKITEFQCVGETVGKGYTAYNLQGYDDKGTLLFAEVDVRSGKLVRFDYYEPCENVRFDMENSQKIAEEFLTKLGFEDLYAVRVSENGTDADFTFVYKQGDVRVDPDEVKVKICRDRGVVTSFDASRYLKNHKQRNLPDPKLSLSQAQEKLHEGLTLEKGELALVRARGGERLAYEMVCAFGEERYFIYVDADTGNEIAILNAKNR